MIEAGDLLFFTSSNSVFDRMIAWWTKSRFVHVAIAISDTEKIEMLGQGCVKTPITGIQAAVWSLREHSTNYDTVALKDALDWLASWVGKAYGWGDIATAADMIDRAHVFYFVQKGHMDCSALATEFLAKAGGVDLKGNELDVHCVTPALLATILGVK